MDYSKIFFRLNLGLLALLLIINFLTALTPEIGFDALWYHLTLPKLWLLKHQWFFQGGLLYYSPMPRLTETLFIPLIYFFGHTGPKLLQFFSGVLTSVLIFKITKFFKVKTWQGLLAVNLFYITWLVSWQSGSAYIDLFRTLLETYALYLLLAKQRVKGAIVLGLAIGTKWLSLGTLVIYALIFGLSILPISLLVAMPWFFIAYYYTGNFIYPIFSPIIAHTSPNIFLALQRVAILPYSITFPFDDFISPVAGLLVSLSALLLIFTQDKGERRVALIAILGAIISQIINPPSSRFFLPYLPMAAIASSLLLAKLNHNLKKILLVVFSLSSIIVISLRLVAFRKYIPYLTGQQTQNNFLTTQSKKMSGTFIDSDDYVQNNLPANKKYLIDKIHNLYYFPFNYDHTSWANENNGYDYLITIGENEKSTGAKLIHTNELGIQIFKLR